MHAPTPPQPLHQPPHQPPNQPPNQPPHQPPDQPLHQPLHQPPNQSPHQAPHQAQHFSHQTSMHAAEFPAHSHKQEVGSVGVCLAVTAAVLRACDHLPLALAARSDRPSCFLIHHTLPSTLSSHALLHRHILALHTNLPTTCIIDTRLHTPAYTYTYTYTYK